MLIVDRLQKWCIRRHDEMWAEGYEVTHMGAPDENPSWFFYLRMKIFGWFAGL